MEPPASAPDTGSVPDVAASLSLRAKAHGFTTSTELKRRLSGLTLAWPWLDRAGLWLLRRASFPASRVWAAAQVADADIHRFYAVTGMPRRSENDARLAAALAKFQE